MKKSGKKIGICLAVLLIFVSLLSGCGSGENTGSAQAEGSSGTVMTRESYIAEVNSICDEILSVSSEYEPSMSSEDAVEVLEATKSMVGEIRPLYVDLGELKAPAEFEEQQEQISEGCDASVEVLDLSVQLMEMESVDQNQEEIQNITSRIAELSPKLSDLNTVLNEVRSA